MNIPLIKSDAKTPEEKLFHKAIQKEAWRISKLAMMRKLTTVDVDNLELLYKKYFKKFPNKEREEASTVRIKKLRQII